MILGISTNRHFTIFWIDTSKKLPIWQKNIKADNLFFVDIWELPKLVTHKLEANFKQWRHNFDKDFYLSQYKVYVKIKTRIKSENFLNFLHLIELKKSKHFS